MSRSARQTRLDAILEGTSRSFYLTLKVLPRAVRGQMGTAYLFCRAADTIADTRLLPPSERLEHLATYREQFETGEPSKDAIASIAGSVGAPLEKPEERELLRALADCFDVYLGFDAEDRALIERLVTTLTQGMEMDLRTFPAEESGDVVGLDDEESLDRYCYFVAGCVGEFWTDLSLRHLRGLRSWDGERMRRIGVRFGQGLQLTNILRDVDADLRIGRCYLPGTRLEPLGLDARWFLGAVDRRAVRPVVHDLIRKTIAHYEKAWEYTLAIPRRLPMLRLACVWPLWIGLRTLELLAAAEDPCAPGEVRKIARVEVKRLMRRSVVRVLSDRALDRFYRHLRSRVVRLLAADESAP